MRGNKKIEINLNKNNINKKIKSLKINEQTIKNALFLIIPTPIELILNFS
jgi:hypothetical protein